MDVNRQRNPGQGAHHQAGCYMWKEALQHMVSVFVRNICRLSLLFSALEHALKLGSVFSSLRYQDPDILFNIYRPVGRASY